MGNKRRILKIGVFKMIKRENLERKEEKELKSYACFSKNNERLNPNNQPINPHSLRTEFQRDRDRIIHSKSFRRLEYKTQVYLTETGDHLRTRLTHSLEVSQIARTIAIQLGLNVDLVEAIALGHDVGHTPFGHAAEKELNKLLIEDNLYGFKHNIQSVSIFYELEKKYDYDGLSLTIPVLEGILKHTKLKDDLPNYFNNLYLDKNYSVTLEGQIVAIADEIAQITHDLDDYLRFGIIELKEIFNHEIFSLLNGFFQDNYDKNFENILASTQEERKKDVTIRCLVDFLVTTLINEVEGILRSNLKSMKIDKEYIKYFDNENVIKSFHNQVSQLCINDYRVEEMDKRGKNIIRTLYNHYKKRPEKLPDSTYEKFKNNGLRVIANYISGMTDRYAIKQYNNIIKF